MTIAELKLKRRTAIDLQQYCDDRIGNRAKYLKELGIQANTDIQFAMWLMLRDSTSREIAVLNKEIKERNAQYTKENVRDKNRDEFDRMMRGNYNKYGGETL